MEKTNALPYNLEAEQSILGSMLIDMEIQQDIISKLKENDFFIESHKLIFASMFTINNENGRIDLVTLSDAMEKCATLERAGGLSYITELSTITPSSANYEYYLNIVKRDSTLRRLIRCSESIIKDARFSTDSTKSVALAESGIYEISEQLDTSSLSSITTSFSSILDKFNAIQKDKNYFQGLKTGFREFDKLTKGLQKSNLIILAARPSVGKTTLAMNIVENVALNENAVCAVFSLEMNKEELGQRMLCSVAGVSSQLATTGGLKDEDWSSLWKASKSLSKTSIYVDDTAMTTSAEILSKCRRLKSRKGRLDLILVDHIQLMNAVKSSDSRQQEVTEISRSLKMIAKELEVPVIALSQLSRQVTSRKGHKPMLSDLRESGAIEQDADIVMFIHRPEMSPDAEEVSKEKYEKGYTEIILAKNRAGELRSFPLSFQGEKSRFVNPPPSYVKHLEEPGESDGVIFNDF